MGIKHGSGMELRALGQEQRIGDQGICKARCEVYFLFLCLAISWSLALDVSGDFGIYLDIDLCAGFPYRNIHNRSGLLIPN